MHKNFQMNYTTKICKWEAKNTRYCGFLFQKPHDIFLIFIFLFHNNFIFHKKEKDRVLSAFSKTIIYILKQLCFSSKFTNHTIEIFGLLIQIGIVYFVGNGQIQTAFLTVYIEFNANIGNP